MLKTSRSVVGALGGFLLLAAGVGCTRVTFKDSVDLTLDFAPLVGPSDLLHTPYVEGSSMLIYVDSTDDNERYTDWYLSSSDPSIFALEALQPQKGYAFAKGRALRPGQVTLTVSTAGGSVIATDVVDVQRPDEVRLLSHGLLLVDRTDEEARVSDLHVVTGGTGTYLARYFRGGQPLYGNGALGATTDPGASATVAKSFLFEDRDWLQVSPSDDKPHSVTLHINGTPLTTVPLSTVPRSDVSSIRILGQDESRARKDQQLVAFALASDRAGQAVYGVEYQWQLGSTTQPGLGDLFRYPYDPSRPQMLTARTDAATGQMMAQAMIHASRGFVDSTNRVGCRSVPGQGSSDSPWLLWLSLLPAASLLVRRRRAV